MPLQSLGKITITAAGTPVRATNNQTVPSAGLKVQSFAVFALSTNGGANMYIGNVSTMNKSTGVGVVGVVPKGTWVAFGVDFAPNGLDVSQIYLDGDSNSDAAIVAAVVQ